MEGAWPTWIGTSQRGSALATQSSKREEASMTTEAAPQINSVILQAQHLRRVINDKHLVDDISVQIERGTIVHPFSSIADLSLRISLL